MSSHSWLFSRVNYETFHKIPTTNLSMNLRRMQTLLDRLGNPERAVKCVHVAGTKGKGSTCHLLESIVRCAGYKTGLFTSPHILHIEERIALNGKPCSEEQFDEWENRVRPIVEQMDKDSVQLGAVTFFEITTAMAFWAFAESNVDLAILETGLGGRLDSTNVCKPLATAITSIGIDHVAVLGDTEEKIAREKAGIIKHGVPVVLGRMHKEPRQVIEQVAQEKNAPMIEADRDFTWRYVPDPCSLTGKLSCDSLQDIKLNLSGSHQAGNAAIAIELTKILNSLDVGLSIGETAIRDALKSIRIPGRIDMIRTNPTIIIDAAHNPDSFSKLAEAVSRFNLPRENCGLVFACADDKDAMRMFRLVYPYFGTWRITRFQNNPRSCSTARLLEIFRQLESEQIQAGKAGMNDVRALDSSSEAIQSMLGKTNTQMVCVAGSFYLAGEMYGWFEKNSGNIYYK